MDSIRRVQVLLPYPFPGPFDYSVPPDCDPQPGDIALVPLNRREELGVVWDTEQSSAAGPRRGEERLQLGGACPNSDAGSGPVPDHKLKPLIGLVDTPPMREDLRRLVNWMAAYTLAPPGEVMAMALRVNRAAPGPASGWRLADPQP
ncbi:MAG TPA: primosomal protein N', partial [Acetobacteraceae bacterium]